MVYRVPTDVAYLFCVAAPKTNGHASGGTLSELAEAPRSSAEWVEALVQQMAGAKDVDDARERASQVLQAFEQAVLQAARSQVGTSVHLKLISNTPDIAKCGTYSHQLCCLCLCSPRSVAALHVNGFA